MFGLENNNKKAKKEEFFFDIEQEIKDPVKKKHYLDKAQKSVQKLKEILNAGLQKEEIFDLTILLNAYTSLFKVISRKPKSKFK